MRVRVESRNDWSLRFREGGYDIGIYISASSIHLNFSLIRSPRFIPDLHPVRLIDIDLGCSLDQHAAVI